MVTPADGGATDVVTATGETVFDAGPAPLGCIRHTMNLTNDIPTLKNGGDWHQVEVGSATFAVEDGGFVTRLAGGSTSASEASMYFDVPYPPDAGFADVIRMRCEMRVVVSSFAGDGRLFQFRLFPGQSTTFDDARLEWSIGDVDNVRIAAQTHDDAGMEIGGRYLPAPKPPAGTPLALITELTLEPTPHFVVDLDKIHLETDPLPPFDKIREGDISVGIYSPAGAAPFEVRYDNVVCDICTKQPR